jgi:hypothetical protein
MARFTPLTKKVWHLGGGYYSSIQGPDHNVVGSSIVDLYHLVPFDPVIKLDEFISQLTNSTGSQLMQISLSPPCVFSADAHQATKGQVVAAEHFVACNKACRKGLIVAVPDSHRPRIIRDGSLRDGDGHDSEVPSSIVRESMGLIGDGEATTFQLFFDF